MGARTLSAAMLAAAQERTYRPLVLVRIAFDSGTVLACSADRHVVFNGETYLGVGIFGKCSKVSESVNLQAQGVKLTLSGVKAELLTLATGEPYQGRECKIWYGMLGADYQLLDDPIMVFRGIVDTMDVAYESEATIEVSCENQLVDWERPRIRRYTEEDQQSRFPGDKGLQYVTQMIEKTLVWGKTT